MTTPAPEPGESEEARALRERQRLEVEALFDSDRDEKPAGENDEDTHSDGRDESLTDEDESDGNADENDDPLTFVRRMRYARRTTVEHLAVFVEYAIRLHSEPDFLSTVDDKEYYEVTIKAVQKMISDVTHSLRLQNWSAPFTTTLDSRPVLIFEFVSLSPFPRKPFQEPNTLATKLKYPGCAACWTRGDFSCDVEGIYELWTEGESYDPKTFKDILEEAESDNEIEDITDKDSSDGDMSAGYISEEESCYETSIVFKNRALALKRPYPPGFKLRIGARCLRRVVAYHTALHYMRNVYARIGDEPLDDPQALVRFNAQVLQDFLSDKLRWERFQYRSDDQ
ncbi:hypothetical protein C8R43DRAFT_984051 [Mycena crocata]|nr:hypothetical protein C8R43DRAFT_984051 [Mycena crocata]